MHLSIFPPEGVTVGIPTAKTVTALRNLTDDFGTGEDLRCFSEKISKNLSKFEGMQRGFFKQNCVTWMGN